MPLLRLSVLQADLIARVHHCPLFLNHLIMITSAPYDMGHPIFPSKINYLLEPEYRRQTSITDANVCFGELEHHLELEGRNLPESLRC